MYSHLRMKTRDTSKRLKNKHTQPSHCSCSLFRLLLEGFVGSSSSSLSLTSLARPYANPDLEFIRVSLIKNAVSTADNYLSIEHLKKSNGEELAFKIFNF